MIVMMRVLATQAMHCGKRGRVAQLVEQGIENPRVGGSIPSPATMKFKGLQRCRPFSFLKLGRLVPTWCLLVMTLHVGLIHLLAHPCMKLGYGPKCAGACVDLLRERVLTDAAINVAPAHASDRYGPLDRCQFFAVLNSHVDFLGRVPLK